MLGGRRKRVEAGSRRRVERPRADSGTVDSLFAEYRRTRDPEIRNRLVLRHEHLVRHLAARFAYRGEPFEDLVQAGSIALIHAVERFDPERGTKFATFATPTIFGELRRYFRDTTWRLKPPRALQELSFRLVRANETLAQRYGRAPTVAEIAAYLGAAEEELLAAMEFSSSHEMLPLDSPFHLTSSESTTTLVDELGADDPALRRVAEYAPLRAALYQLSHRDRELIRLRFYEELSQKEVAKHLGVSQMHVSRLERQALRRLRELLTAAVAEVCA